MGEESKICMVPTCMGRPWFIGTDIVLCKAHAESSKLQLEDLRRDLESPISEPLREAKAEAHETGLAREALDLVSGRKMRGRKMREAQRKSYPDGGVKVIDECLLPSGHEGEHVYDRVREIAERASHATLGAAPQVPPAAQALCETCKGEGFVMVPIASASGFPTERRERCATCNGIGAKRCNAEGRAGDLCKLAPGHEGEHRSGRGVKWVEPHASGAVQMCLTAGRWEVVAMGYERPLKKSDHFCGPGYPPPPDLDAKYAVWCKREKSMVDVTDVVVRGFVVPYEEHAEPPPVPAAAPRPSSDPEPIAEIVPRILKDLRALVRAATR